MGLFSWLLIIFFCLTLDCYNNTYITRFIIASTGMYIATSSIICHSPLLKMLSNISTKSSVHQIYALAALTFFPTYVASCPCMTVLPLCFSTLPLFLPHCLSNVLTIQIVSSWNINLVPGSLQVIYAFWTWPVAVWRRRKGNYCGEGKEWK